MASDFDAAALFDLQILSSREDVRKMCAADSRCYRETQERHTESLCAFAKVVRQVYPDALCPGADGCRICSFTTDVMARAVTKA